MEILIGFVWWSLMVALYTGPLLWFIYSELEV